MEKWNSIFRAAKNCIAWWSLAAQESAEHKIINNSTLDMMSTSERYEEIGERRAMPVGEKVSLNTLLSRIEGGIVQKRSKEGNNMEGNNGKRANEQDNAEMSKRRRRAKKGGEKKGDHKEEGGKKEHKKKRDQKKEGEKKEHKKKEDQKEEGRRKLGAEAEEGKFEKETNSRTKLKSELSRTPSKRGKTDEKHGENITKNVQKIHKKTEKKAEKTAPQNSEINQKINPKIFEKPKTTAKIKQDGQIQLKNPSNDISLSSLKLHTSPLEEYDKTIKPGGSALRRLRAERRRVERESAELAEMSPEERRNVKKNKELDRALKRAGGVKVGADDAGRLSKIQRRRKERKIASREAWKIRLEDKKSEKIKRQLERKENIQKFRTTKGKILIKRDNLKAKSNQNNDKKNNDNQKNDKNNQKKTPNKNKIFNKDTKKTAHNNKSTKYLKKPTSRSKSPQKTGYHQK